MDSQVKTMIDIDNINKYIINLDDRKDRWNHIVQEFKYMRWDYIRFPAINTGDYHGCARSHMAVAEIGIKENLDYLLVCEDDAFFMPYAKEHLRDCLSALDNIEWDMFHLGPIIHRPLNMDRNDCLIDLSNNLPPANDNHRGILGTTAMIYKKSILLEILKWPEVFDKWENYNCMEPIDMFFSKYIYPNFKCFSGNLPIATQIRDESTVNGGQILNQHYTVTYNWKSYINKNFPNTFFDYDYCKQNRK